MLESVSDERPQSVLVDFSAASSVGVVAFGGLKLGAMGLPPFEFFKVLDSVQTKRVFVRDLNQCWYQCGLEGVADDVAGTADYLRDLCCEAGIERTIFTGTSAGGYAALLFGSLLDADEVHAFSPQTFLSRRLRLRYRDFRWRGALHRMRSQVRARHAYLDLRPLLAMRPQSQPYPAIHIYYGVKEGGDVTQARRLSGLPGVTLHEFQRGHRLVRHLRDSGELERLLVDAVQRQSRA